MNVSLSGPATACPGTEQEYTRSGTGGIRQVTFRCTNCTLWDPEIKLWVGSLIYHVDYDPVLPTTVTARMGQNGISKVEVTVYKGSNNASDDVDTTTGAPSVTAATITGADFLANCNSATNTYYLSNISSGWSLDEWQAYSPLSKSNETPTAVDISSSSTSYSGKSPLKAVVEYSEQGVTCGQQIIKKDIWLGKPSNAHIRIVDYSTGQPPYYLCAMDNNYLLAEHTLNIDPVSDWDWQSSYNWYLDYPDYPDKSIALIFADNSSGTVGIRAYNACGWSNWNNYSYSVTSCGYFMTLYPNPSSSELNIDITDSGTGLESAAAAGSEISTSTTKEVKFDIQIFDGQKELVYKKNNVVSPYQVNTMSFSSGIYVLNVILGDEVLKETIVIE